MTPDLKALAERLTSDSGCDPIPIYESAAALLWAAQELATVKQEIERLQREVMNRNQRALDGDKAVSIRESLLEEIERKDRAHAVIFDGWAVYQALTRPQQHHISHEQVSIILDAIAKIWKGMDQDRASAALAKDSNE